MNGKIGTSCITGKTSKISDKEKNIRRLNYIRLGQLKKAEEIRPGVLPKIAKSIIRQSEAVGYMSPNQGRAIYAIWMDLAKEGLLRGVWSPSN